MASVSRTNHNPTVMKMINPFVKFLVRRGWGSIANDVMVLHWNGRKSGNSYSTPVSRFEINGQLFTQTKAPYKSNFAGGGPAELVTPSKRASYTATLVADAAAVGQRMHTVLNSQGIKKGSRALGLKIRGEPSVAELAEFVAADGAAIIDFE
jgi:hypothetical protein